MTFDPFVLPFSIGLLYLMVVVAERFRHWFVGLPPKVKRTIGKRVISSHTLAAIWEIIREGLFHRNLWRRNPLLGYMHMSFALGWFLLIVLGNIESRFYSQLHVNPPYYPIFLKFFVHDSHVLPFELSTIPGFFRFTMDFLLLYVLSGLMLAWIKRTRSRWFGMISTTRHNAADRVALTALWLIFPLRLLAESFTAGCFGGGGFLTNTLGAALASFLPEEHLYYPLWWAYSFALGVFFMLLPYSRYMHILAEMGCIMLKHWGGGEVLTTQSYYECSMQACSRCGVCLDQCQVALAGNPGVSPVSFIRELRAGRIPKEIAEGCLMCRRCQDVCPVGIGLINLRQWAREQLNGRIPVVAAPRYSPVEMKAIPDVVWFAGCMSHLSPGLIRSVQLLFKQAGVKYYWLDADGSICCGRPAQLTGRTAEAEALIEVNRQAILDSGAKLLVTNCPICYRVFCDHYDLPIEVMHHSSYFLRLIDQGQLQVSRGLKAFNLHIPCELDRTSVDADRMKLLASQLVESSEVISQSEWCCGGSLGRLSGQDEVTRKISTDAAFNTAQSNLPVVTGCPLCKKTLQRYTKVPVSDIAEQIYLLSAAEKVN
jgi:Fe-S oxidoreductase